MAYWRISFGGTGTALVSHSFGLIVDRVERAPRSVNHGLLEETPLAARLGRFDLRFPDCSGTEAITLNGFPLCRNDSLSVGEEEGTGWFGVNWRTGATVLAVAVGGVVLGVALSETLGDDDGGASEGDGGDGGT